jgi:hypothetical protein
VGGGEGGELAQDALILEHRGLGVERAVVGGGRPTAWASQVAACGREEKVFYRRGRGRSERGEGVLLARSRRERARRRRSTGEVAARVSEENALDRLTQWLERASRWALQARRVARMSEENALDR